MELWFYIMIPKNFMIFHFCIMVFKFPFPISHYYLHKVLMGYFYSFFYQFFLPLALHFWLYNVLFSLLYTVFLLLFILDLFYGY